MAICTNSDASPCLNLPRVSCGEISCCRFHEHHPKPIASVLDFPGFCGRAQHSSTATGVRTCPAKLLGAAGRRDGHCAAGGRRARGAAGRHDRQRPAVHGHHDPDVLGPGARHAPGRDQARQHSDANTCARARDLALRATGRSACVPDRRCPADRPCRAAAALRARTAGRCPGHPSSC